jgi:eukaryotic-like serine/threonine-protein kinase
MGEIFRAEDADLARIVAIKVLADRYANDEAIRARFTREALAAARLSNAPSTVTIFDVGEHEDHPYIVMEYLAGGSLADRLARDGAQPIGRSLDWLQQAAAALDAAHANGVVHRDVKPANLLLDNDDRVKVADFGVASAVGTGLFTQGGKRSGKSS